MNETYLTPAEVVARYKGAITEKTLANWRVNRDGPAWTKVGGRVLYPLGSLVEWERARTVAGRVADAARRLAAWLLPLTPMLA